MQSAALAESLRRATHPLALPPAGLPWNLQELDGLLAPGEPRQAAVLVAEAFEVPLDLLLDPAMLEEIELHFGGRPRHVLQYRYERQRIWGVTASILFNLRERLASATPGRD